MVTNPTRCAKTVTTINGLTVGAHQITGDTNDSSK